jgi:hypothetical protein
MVATIFLHLSWRFCRSRSDGYPQAPADPQLPTEFVDKLVRKHTAIWTSP